MRIAPSPRHLTKPAQEKDAETFFHEYAARSGTTVERLRELGRDVFPCDCDAPECEGWQVRNARDYADDPSGL